MKFPCNVSKNKGGNQPVAMDKGQILNSISGHVLRNMGDFNNVVCKCGCRYFEPGNRAKMVSGFDACNPLREAVVVNYSVTLCRECKVEIVFSCSLVGVGIGKFSR